MFYGQTMEYLTKIKDDVEIVGHKKTEMDMFGLDVKYGNLYSALDKSLKDSMEADDGTKYKS